MSDFAAPLPLNEAQPSLGARPSGAGVCGDAKFRARVSIGRDAELFTKVVGSAGWLDGGGPLDDP